MAIDPVCHMEVNPDEAAEYEEYGGKTYYFCSIACAEKFVSDPQRYAGVERGGQLKNPPGSSI